MRAAHVCSGAVGSRQQNPHVLVVGTGVIGLATALRILRDLPGTQVTLVGQNIGRTATRQVLRLALMLLIEAVPWLQGCS
jgi:threonine dehydrogenase-like Zn-dependent dehydrogenase